jgi:hypothetical protein
MSDDSTGLAILELVQFFLPRCADQSTLRELEAMAADDSKWRHGHALFTRIRDKTLRADDSGNHILQHQYAFEEICAKALFNMSPHYDPECKQFPAPFDSDSAFWVVSFAVSFAKALGIADPCAHFKLFRSSATQS